MCIVVAESTALCPQVTEMQLACVKALAAEPALKWVIPRWKLDGVRALLGRPESESAGALVSAIKERLNRAESPEAISAFQRVYSGAQWKDL